MSIQLGELNSRIFVDLPLVDEYCSLDDVHRALVRKYNIRLAQSRVGSDKNVLLSTSAEFTPTSVTHNVTALIGKGEPAWIEMQTGTGQYYPIRIINYSQLADYTALGEFACAFWAEDSDVVSIEPVQYVTFTFQPSAACRIKYDRDNVKAGLGDVVMFPDYVADLIVLETQNELIARKILPKMAIDLRRNEEGRKDVREIKEALNGVYKQNLIDIEDLKRLWEIWAFRSRDAQSSFNKPTPSGRNMYGDGFSY